MSAMNNLDARIAAAFSDAVKSADVEALIKAAEAASLAADEDAERARSRALAPTMQRSGVIEARRKMDDAAFERDRMRVAAAKLRERLAELRDQEENSRRQVAYDEAAAARDEVAKQLAEFYPGLAEKLSGLLARLVRSDYDLGLVNAKLPKGAPRLERAEFVAKDIVGRPIVGFVSVTECYLPPWTPHSPHRWPPVK
jgi:hypothetical protein